MKTVLFEHQITKFSAKPLKSTKNTGLPVLEPCPRGYTHLHNPDISGKFTDFAARNAKRILIDLAILVIFWQIY